MVVYKFKIGGDVVVGGGDLDGGVGDVGGVDVGDGDGDGDGAQYLFLVECKDFLEEDD